MFHTELTDAERQRWKQMIQVAFDRFLKIVARDRKLTLEAGQSGRRRPAHDGRRGPFPAPGGPIGYLDDAIQEAWNLAKLESSRVIRYARPMSLSETLFSFQSRQRARPRS